ncbi:MAG: hypothetical protein ACKV2Q_18635 [Planctomycetaceae bacterium]
MPPSSFLGFITALLDCLRSWWRVDRIRTSPAEGRLLRLHPPCFVVIGGRSFEVAHRVVGQDAEGPFVDYNIHSSDGPARLLVRLIVETSQTVIRWIGPEGERSLMPREVEVFEPSDWRAGGRYPNGTRAVSRWR